MYALLILIGMYSRKKKTITTNEEQEICLVIITWLQLMWPFLLNYFFSIITRTSINIVVNDNYACICVNDPFKGE